MVRKGRPIRDRLRWIESEDMNSLRRSYENDLFVYREGSVPRPETTHTVAYGFALVNPAYYEQRFSDLFELCDFIDDERYSQNIAFLRKR